MADPARDLALSVLFRVSTRGAWSGAALRAELDKAPDLDPRDKSLATELVYGVLRHRIQLDRAISAFGKRLKDLDPKLHDVFRLAAYQLLFLDRIPDHAIVNAAVDQARKRRGERGAKQVNAILRKLADQPREQRLPKPPPLDKDPARHISETCSLPRNLVELLLAQMRPEAALAFGLANLQRPQLSLRANLLKTTRDALLEELSAIPGQHPRQVELETPGALPADFLAVVEGRATPQDLASMMVVDLLDPQPGETVLDLCAAPGGKTTYMAERMEDRGRVLAHDVTPEKLEQIRQTSARLGLRSVETIEVPPALSEPVDRVLIDAPCTGTGTLRRHPEARWRFRSEDLDRITRTQAQLLELGAGRLASGGTLVYSVCSVLRPEAEAIVETFLAEHPELELVESLRTGPDQTGAPDGFYAAKLKKR